MGEAIKPDLASLTIDAEDSLSEFRRKEEFHLLQTPFLKFLKRENSRLVVIYEGQVLRAVDLRHDERYELRRKKMTNFMKAILAIIIVIVVWTILGRFVAGIMGFLFAVAMLTLFVGAIVYAYKMLTRQKI